MDGHFLTDIEIKQFKCFTDFKAAGFKRVNLIGGKNNVGKTAFMEACYINVHSNSINAFITAIYSIKFARESLNVFQQKSDELTILESTEIYTAISNLKNIKYALQKKDATKSYLINILNRINPTVSEAINLNKTIKAKDLSINISHISNIHFIDNFGWDNAELVNAYQVVQKIDMEFELNSLVNEFDNSIANFKVIGDNPQCKTNGEYRDINEFGDGLKHYISIICGLYACENGYLFIDEIDNGIHYSQLDRLWEIILTLSKKTNCQVFASTHSKEMLEAFARVAEKLAEQDISYTILVKNKQQELKTISLDYEMLLDSVKQGHEVR